MIPSPDTLIADSTLEELLDELLLEEWGTELVELIELVD